MRSKVSEFFSFDTRKELDWKAIVQAQQYPFLNRKCLKTRKSLPVVSLGTCSISRGGSVDPVIICPHRFLESGRIFFDALHLLLLHEPGNDIYAVPEISVAGGRVDYMLVSAKNQVVKDIVGIELQALDTTGSLWNERQRFLEARGIPVEPADLQPKAFGLNWKMTAKTILMQLHHKISAFEHMHKHIILVAQDCFIDYLKSAFEFSHVQEPRKEHMLHLHAYEVEEQNQELRIQLSERLSTDSEGLAKAIGLQAQPEIEIQALYAKIQEKLAPGHLLRF